MQGTYARNLVQTHLAKQRVLVRGAGISSVSNGKSAGHQDGRRHGLQRWPASAVVADLRARYVKVCASQVNGLYWSETLLALLTWRFMLAGGTR